MKYLDARVRDEAVRLLERAAAGGLQTTEVQFYRLIALLSGRTLRQLGDAELDRLTAICGSLLPLDANEPWAAGVQAVLRLLTPVSPAEAEFVIKEIDALGDRQRESVYGHLEALPRRHDPGRDVATVRCSGRYRRRTSDDRVDRVWKFFQPVPAQPRTREVAPTAVTDRQLAPVRYRRGLRRALRRLPGRAGHGDGTTRSHRWRARRRRRARRLRCRGR